MLPHFLIKIHRRNLKKLFIIYSCALSYVVFLTPNRYRGEGIQINLVPIVKTYEEFFALGNQHFWDFYIVYWANILGNIILFMPFSFLISCLYPKKSSRTILLYSFLTSVGIEITQLLLQIGVCDIDDVILNVTGAAAGLWVYKIMMSRRKKRYDRNMVL